MRKIALLVFVFLLTGCSQKNITSPLMIVDLIPKNFEIIYFNEDIPYQTKYFLEYKEQGYSCFTETGSNRAENVCYDMTGFYGEYTIPERELKVTERTGCGKEDAYSWVLFPQRNHACYLTGDKLISLHLKTEKMYNFPWEYDETVRETKTFRNNPPTELDESSSFYIQYTPTGEKRILEFIDKLLYQGEILEETPCNFGNIFSPKGSICYWGKRGYNEKGELNGQNVLYLFHPKRKFYYKFYSIGGNIQCEGNGFGTVEFFYKRT